MQGRQVDAEGAIIGQTILFDKIADAAYRPVVAAAPGGWLVAWVEFDGAGIGGNFMIAAQEINQDGQPLGEQFIASSGYGPVGEAALAGSAERDHYLLAWNGKGIFGVTPFRIYSSALERSQMLQTTTIQYDYDPLYRLTEAVYTGAITATYSYLYDAVGNMTAYTETVGTETSNVTRTFDPANRLQTALDSEQGTSSYYFDNSGNLVEILPPGADGQNPDGRLRYGYDQRNLLITSTLHISGTGEVLQVAFIYDGAGNRVQQVDYRSGQPITTTYTNDNSGLSQVLVSDDGATQTHNLFGLSLIYQDNGAETRALLADGLGSVRLEMVGGAVDSAATYEPYGKLLARSGPSGTVYGFTGEQHDAATGLVYLRARYYSPSLKIFLSMDPWAGNPHRPMSYNKYLYVYANPVNLVDPAGLCAEFGDDACWGVYEQIIRLCPECAHIQREWVGGSRPLHEENIYYLRLVLENVKAGWRPLFATTIDEAIQLEAARFGVPGEIVAGVLEAEIKIDTEWWDPIQTKIASNSVGAWAMATVRPNPGVGIGNFHARTARSTARHYENYYQECIGFRLDISQNHSDALLTWRATNDQYNIRLIAAHVRQLADYRFGSSGMPLTSSHADLSKWTLQDGIAIWHGYRYGVPEVSPGGQGFRRLEHFQDRSYTLNELINSVIVGTGAVESAGEAVPIFSKYLEER